MTTSYDPNIGSLVALAGTIYQHNSVNCANVDPYTSCGLGTCVAFEVLPSDAFDFASHLDESYRHLPFDQDIAYRYLAAEIEYRGGITGVWPDDWDGLYQDAAYAGVTGQKGTAERSLASLKGLTWTHRILGAE